MNTAIESDLQFLVSTHRQFIVTNTSGPVMLPGRKLYILQKQHVIYSHTPNSCSMDAPSKSNMSVWVVLYLGKN